MKGGEVHVPGTCKQIIYTGCVTLAGSHIPVVLLSGHASLSSKSSCYISQEKHFPCHDCVFILLYHIIHLDRGS